MVGANASQQFGTATLQLSGTANSTFTAMANDPSRPSTFQIGGSTFQFNANTALVSLSNPSACTCEFLNWGCWAGHTRPPEQWHNLYRCRDLRCRYTHRPAADDGQRDV